MFSSAIQSVTLRTEPNSLAVSESVCSHELTWHHPILVCDRLEVHETLPVIM
jgi:hypothetical protein